MIVQELKREGKKSGDGRGNREVWCSKTREHQEISYTNKPCMNKTSTLLIKMGNEKEH